MYHTWFLSKILRLYSIWECHSHQLWCHILKFRNHKYSSHNNNSSRLYCSESLCRFFTLRYTFSFPKSMKIWAFHRLSGQNSCFLHLINLALGHNRFSFVPFPWTVFPIKTPKCSQTTNTWQVKSSKANILQQLSILNKQITWIIRLAFSFGWKDP